MRLKLKNFCLLFVLFPLLSGCEGRDKNYEMIVKADGTKEISKEETISPVLKNGTEVSILPNEWMEYFNKSIGPTDINNFYIKGKETTAPLDVEIKWLNKNETHNYTFLLSNKKDMSNPAEFDVTETSAKVKDLFAGTTYYYQVKAHYEDYYVLSKRFEFKTVDFIRTLGIGGVTNARDLGNKKNRDGKKRVKQGLVFRSANLDEVTTLGKEEAINKYGIKTDLDLRQPNDVKTSPLGPEVKYINNGVGSFGSPFYVSYGEGVNAPDYYPAMRDNLKVFADKNNLPTIFHCAVGRDRTGSLAMTLYLLLGVNLDQIKQDFMVSFFSRSCNAMDPEEYATYMENTLKYFDHYKSDGLSNKADIYARVERYCLDIGLSKSDISAIKNNLLEDIKK